MKAWWKQLPHWTQFAIILAAGNLYLAGFVALLAWGHTYIIAASFLVMCVALQVWVVFDVRRADLRWEEQRRKWNLDKES